MTDPKMKQRGGNATTLNKKEAYPEDDLNQSYVLDYKEDKRARAADRNKGETNNNNNSLSPRKAAARNKMRQLEGRFGSSAPTQLSYQNNSDQCANRTTPTRNKSFPIRPSPPSLLLLEQQQTNNSSDSSMDFGDLENQQRQQQQPPRRIMPSKASKQSQSLNGYILGNNSNKEGRIKSSSKAASRGSNDSKRNNDGTKRKIQMRDTDRLIRASGKTALERQDSGMLRIGNASSPAMLLRRQNSLGNVSANTTTNNNKSSSSSAGGGRPSRALVRTPSIHEQRRGRSKDERGASHRPPITRQRSKTMGRRSRSMSLDRRSSSTKINTKGQRRSRSQSVDRRGSLKDTKSKRSQQTIYSELYQPTTIKRGDSTVLLLPLTQEQARHMPVGAQPPPKNGTLPFLANGSFYPSYFPRKIPPMEETPPKSLVLIWIVVSAELAFDLATTIIAFVSLVDEDECCGERIELGPIPMTVTTPFFLLVLAELAFLFRAMLLAMWPSIFTGEVTDEDRELRSSRNFCIRCLCCWLRWKAKIILKILNFLVVMNPFFGCIIAWMLLYQSDKVESFVVLGLEGGAVLLHFFSVYLEGSCKTWVQFACHCIPLLPFIASVTLILFYFKQGGVCYSVDSELFLFTGCQLCANGYPPIDNQCLINGTNVTINNDGLFNFDDVAKFSDVGGVLTRRVVQGDFCGNLQDEGPDMSFCFFKYD